MVETLMGMAMDTKDEQPQNAPAPIVAILLGTVNAPVLPPGHWSNVVMAILYKAPSTLAKFRFIASTSIDLSDVQDMNV
jgi:hypothetical protein